VFPPKKVLKIAGLGEGDGLGVLLLWEEKLCMQAMPQLKKKNREKKGGM